MAEIMEKRTLPTRTGVRRSGETFGSGAERDVEAERSAAAVEKPARARGAAWLTGRVGGLAVMFASGVAIAAAGVLFAPGRPNRTGNATHAPLVVPAAAEPGTVLVAIGRSEPKGEERNLAFAVGGLVRSVAVQEGQEVKPGAVLAELVNDEERAAVGLAEAESAEARAALAQIKAGPQTEEVQAAEAEAARARLFWEMLQTGPREEKRRELKAEYQEALLRVENARNALTRLEPAFKADSISREAMNQARDELRTAEAAGAAAQARLELGTAKERPEEIKRAELAWRAAQLAWARLKAQPRLEDVKTAEARVAVAEARLAAAKASLAKTVLLAAKAGVVLQVHAREGERVDGPVLVLGDLSRMRLRVEVDEHDVGRLQIGQKVVATARGLGEQEFSGRVTQIGRRMGRKRLFTDAPDERADTHVLEALVELDGRPDLPTGFRFRVLFYDKEREPTLKQSNGDE